MKVFIKLTEARTKKPLWFATDKIVSMAPNRHWWDKNEEGEDTLIETISDSYYVSESPEDIIEAITAAS